MKSPSHEQVEITSAGPPVDQTVTNATEKAKELSAAELHGRAVQQQEHNRSYWRTLRSDPKLLFWIGVMLWTMGVRGFENQAGGAVLGIPEFKQRFGEPLEGADGQYFIATNWQSAIAGGGNAFTIIGATAASYLVDWYGYKKVVCKCIPFFSFFFLFFFFSFFLFSFFFSSLLLPLLFTSTPP